MKISDLNESSRDMDLDDEIMNIIMMFHKTGADKTDINNVISELKKNNISVTEQDIVDFVESNKTLSITSDNKIVLDPEADSDSSADDISGVKSPEEYNPAKDKAKKAAEKRLKD